MIFVSQMRKLKVKEDEGTSPQSLSQSRMWDSNLRYFTLKPLFLTTVLFQRNGCI